MRMFLSNELCKQLRESTLVPAILVLAFIVGCQRTGEITTHVIPKSESNLEMIRDAADLGREDVSAAATAEASEARMVVAIAGRPDATWYFKVSGPQNQVDASESQWRSFFAQLKFEDDGKPAWELPDGWKKLGDKPMRFATLAINDETPPLELAISSLAAGQNMLDNVNRWLGQLGLQPTTKDELDSLLETVEADGVSLTVFDATGQLTGGSMTPPFARMGGNRNPGMVTPPRVAEQANADRRLKYETPDGWTEGPSSSIVLARLLKEDGEKKAQISVVTLPAAANEWGPNVIRWAREVGMDSKPQSELDGLAAEVEVDGLAGQVVRLLPEAEDQTRATIAAMIKQGPTAWFFKLTGDKSLVAESSEDFEAFLSSVKLP